MAGADRVAAGLVWRAGLSRVGVRGAPGFFGAAAQPDAGIWLAIKVCLVVTDAFGLR